MTNTISIPFDAGTQTFDRDQLTTAILLRMEHNGDQKAVRTALIEQHGVNPTTATYLTVAARICAERGIEP